MRAAREKFRDFEELSSSGGISQRPRLWKCRHSSPVREGKARCSAEGIPLAESGRSRFRGILGRAALFIAQQIPVVRVPRRDRNMPSISVRRCGADQRGYEATARKRRTKFALRMLFIFK